MSEYLVIIPTYNEKENVELMVRKVFSLPKPFHLLIVDDGSPDGTADIVKSLQLEFPGRLHLAQRAGKQGLGTAYVHGFKWGMERGYRYLFEMDCDFSHIPTTSCACSRPARTKAAMSPLAPATCGAAAWSTGRATVC